MCNVKFKKYDKVVLVKDFNLIGFSIKKGTTGIVLDDSNHPFVQFDIEPNHKLHSAEGLGENGRCFTVGHYFLKSINADYHQSNRHKLHQAIKATGFHAEKLSLATGKAKNYFVGITAESRFIKHGDITEERLNSLLTTLAFAERELLGVGAKTVDDNESVKDLFKDAPSNATHYIENNGDKTYLSVEPVDTEQPKLSNFTKVGIIAIVILLLILIVKNLVV